MTWEDEDEDMIVGISKLWKEGKMKKQKEMIYKDVVEEFTCEYCEYGKASEVRSHPI